MTGDDISPNSGGNIRVTKRNTLRKVEPQRPKRSLRPDCIEAARGSFSPRSLHLTLSLKALINRG